MPETRVSLILRLPRSADADAWREFVEIYEPLILRFARRRGVQDADAHDLVQRVFTSVAGAVDRWKPNPANDGISDRNSYRRSDWSYHRYELLIRQQLQAFQALFR